MSTFGWIAMIVLFVMIAEVAKYYIKMKTNRSEIDEKINKKLEQLAKISELEQRIQSLETILTDPSETLKRDINNL